MCVQVLQATTDAKGHPRVSALQEPHETPGYSRTSQLAHSLQCCLKVCRRFYLKAQLLPCCRMCKSQGARVQGWPTQLLHQLSRVLLPAEGRKGTMHARHSAIQDTTRTHCPLDAACTAPV